MAARALAFAFGFLVHNPGPILRRIAIPGLLWCMALYVLAWAYCTQLADYLGFPSEGLAGRVMGVAAVGLLILLLFHAVVVSRIAELLIGRPAAGSAFLGIRADAWRIYVADLRLLLALGLYGLAVFGISRLMADIGVAPVVDAAFHVAAWLLLFWLMARSWFFLVPVSLQVNETGALTLSWRQSQRTFPATGTIMLALLALALFLLASGEFLLRLAGLLSPIPATLSFSNAISLYERNLWPFVILVSLVYLCSTCLMTAARIKLHQDLAAAPPA